MRVKSKDIDRRSVCLALVQRTGSGNAWRTRTQVWWIGCGSKWTASIPGNLFAGDVLICEGGKENILWLSLVLVGFLLCSLERAIGSDQRRVHFIPSGKVALFSSFERARC